MPRSLVLSLILGLATASSAEACSCAPPPPPKKAMEQAGAVFAGKVVKIERNRRTNVITIAVTRSWKGPLRGELVVRTPNSGAACGYGFKEKESYLVYCYGGKEKPEALMTGLCTRTRGLKDAAGDLKALGEGRVPPGADGEDSGE